MRPSRLLAVLLLSVQGYALVVDGVDLARVRTRCKNVTCVKPNCPYPIFDDNNKCCFTCPPHRGVPIEITLPPPPPPCGNSTEPCPDAFLPTTHSKMRLLQDVQTRLQGDALSQTFLPQSHHTPG